MTLTKTRALGLLSFSHLVDDMYQGAVPAILPFLTLERGYGYAAATGITLAATVISSVAQPVFGALADRGRLLWLTPIGLLVAGIGIGLSGIGESYAWTWCAVALSGLGVAAYHPAAASATRALAGPSAQSMSWFALGGNVGLALGPVLVTPVLLAFGLMGTPLLAIPAVLTAAVLLGLRRRTGVARSARAVEGRDDWRSFGWLTGLVVIRSIVYFGVTSLLGLYVIARFGLSAGTASIMLTAFLGVGAVATILGGWIADRWGKLTAVRLGYTVCLPALALLVLAPSPWLVALAAMAAGIGVYLPFAVQTTLGQDYLPNRIGTASGVTLGLAVSAGGAFAPLLGWLADSHGPLWSLSVLAVLPGLALLISTRLR